MDPFYYRSGGSDWWVGGNIRRHLAGLGSAAEPWDSTGSGGADAGMWEVRELRALVCLVRRMVGR